MATMEPLSNRRPEALKPHRVQIRAGAAGEQSEGRREIEGSVSAA